METIKVIDLLNKIRNEKYVPKKLKYNGDIFKVSGSNYYSPSSNKYLFNETNILKMLNDEVEIIEDTPKEDKKIEKLEITKYPELGEDVVGYPVPERIITKINEIIEVINERNI